MNAAASTEGMGTHAAWQRWAARPEAVTLGLIVLLCGVVGAINPAFFQLGTLFDLLRSATVTGLFALGVLVVLAAGGLDVSFTAIAALVMYGLTKASLELWPTAPVSLVMLAGGVGGLLLGLFNGVLVNRLAAPSLIVTIGTQYLYRGILLTFIGTVFLMNIPAPMDAFGRAALVTLQAGNGARTVLPAFVLVLLAASVVTWFILEHTLMGRAVYAVGGSAPIAERLGYDVRRVNRFVFGYAGLLAGIAGIVHASSNRLANPFDLVGSEIDVIAAVVLGGARITGGTGSVVGTLLGVALVTLINNVLILAGVPSTWQKAIVGGFILLAGGFFLLRRRQARSA